MFWLTGRTNRIYFKKWKCFHFRRPAWSVNPLLLIVIAGTLAGATFGLCFILIQQIDALFQREWNLSFELKEGRGEMKTRQLILAEITHDYRRPFFCEISIVNKSSSSTAGYIDIGVPSYMDISMIMGPEATSLKDTIDTN